MIQRKQSSISSLTGVGWNRDAFSREILVGFCQIWGMVPRA